MTLKRCICFVLWYVCMCFSVEHDDDNNNNHQSVADDVVFVSSSSVVVVVVVIVVDSFNEEHKLHTNNK